MRALAGVAVLIACRGVVPPAAVPAHPANVSLGAAHVVPGEAMEFRVRMRGFPVGIVQTAIGRAGWVEGREAVVVKSRGTSGGLLALFSQLTWELETTLDVRRGLPIANVEESTLVVVDDTEHDRSSHQWSPDDEHHDIHSMVTALRGWRTSRPGVRAAWRVDLGGLDISGELWEAGREYLPAVKTRAVRYDGVALEKYRFAIWISDDTTRAPVAMQTETKWGMIAVDLVNYDPPGEHAP
jgi:hypothetical protein